MIYFKRRFMALGLTLALIVLVGAGCNPFGQKPEEVVKKMTEVMSATKSFSYKLTANMVNKKVDQEKPDSQLELSLTGYGNQFSSSEINFQTSLEGKLLLEGNSTKPLIIPLSAEIRLVKKNFYLKINKATDFPYFDIADLKDKWYKFDQSSNNLLKNNLNTNLSGEELTEDQLLKLRQLLSASSLLKVTKTLKEESIQNISCYHYEASLDSEGVKKFIEEAIKITNQSSLGANGDELNKFLAESTGLKGEIWIGKKDYYLYQIKIVDSRLADNKTVKVETNINLQLFEFNQPKEILAPEGSAELNLNEILGNYFGGFNSSGNINPEAMTLDSDKDGLSDYLESIYKTDPNNPDNDGDGFLDGEEVKNGYNPKGEGKLENFNNLSNY